MVSRIAIGKWFDQRRGLATGISNILVSYFFNASPFLLNAWVDSVGWRTTYLRLAGIAGGGMAVIGWFFYRDSPEACGLQMDGVRADAAVTTKHTRVPPVVRDFTRAEALRTPAFWAYTLSTAWQALFMTAVGFHLTSLGEEQGLSREACYRVFPVIGMVSAGSALVGGWLSDRIRLRWLLITTVVCQVFSAIGLSGLASPGGRLVFVAGYSISAALFGLLLTTVWPRYYGRAHLGAISGLASSILVFASALGPFLFSAIRDAGGSYKPVFWTAAGVPLVLMVLTVFAKNPQHR
jgi:cyanate permease